MTSIKVPNSVTEINSNTFEGCSSLTNISIGNRVEHIYSNAFARCSKLTDFYCNTENVPRTSDTAFNDSYIGFVTLHVPENSIDKYMAQVPWKNFNSIVAIDGGEAPPSQKCEPPTISYENGQLKMSCATEGVEFVTEVADADVKKHYDAIISLSATYNISVYATKEGYAKSEVATATLCWIDSEPMQEGTKEAEDGVTEVKAIPVLIQAEGNTISVQGAAEGTEISAYNTNGIKLSSKIAYKGITTLNTLLPSGTTAIVKIGERAIKVLVK